MNIPERFWSKVDRRPASSCWLWAAHVQRAGYGTFWLNGRHEQAHRVSYEMCVGPIPDGVEIDHTLADAHAAAIRLRNSLFTHNDADRAA